MDTIYLLPELRAELERAAVRSSSSINDLVNKAVKQYLREQRTLSIRQEIQAYVEMHAALASEYMGQWVAIYEHQLVDHDMDTGVLYHRIRAKYGNAPVLIRQVETQPDPEIWVRTPSTGKIPQ